MRQVRYNTHSHHQYEPQILQPNASHNTDKSDIRVMTTQQNQAHIKRGQREGHRQRDAVPPFFIPTSTKLMHTVTTILTQKYFDSRLA